MYHHTTTTSAILALALLVVTVVGQIVSPFATHDCSSQAVYTGDTACNNDLTTCCAVTGTCCAGGCCPGTAICVFMGTANEACCDISDPTLCGSAQSATTKTCPNPAGPSVPCSGVDTSWYCDPGCTCDDSIDEGCNCFSSGGGGDCSGDDGGDSSSAAAATTEAAPTPAPTSVDAGSGSQTTAAGGGAAGGGGATTPSSAAVPAGTTKAAAGKVGVEVVLGVGVGLLMLGVGLVL